MFVAIILKNCRCIWFFVARPQFWSSAECMQYWWILCIR